MERFLVSNLKNDGECCGVTFNECHILMEIYDRGEIVMKDLAENLFMDKSIISRSIELMVVNNLILRKENAEDRRKKVLVLTESGAEKAGEINFYMNKKYESLFKKLPHGESENIMRAAKRLAEVFIKWKESDQGCCIGEKNGCCS